MPRQVLPASPERVEREPRPFLKWAGGKRQLLERLMEHAPARHGRYFEPFLGGGALYFRLRPRRATLADVNERLIRAYRGVQRDVEAVIARLATYRHDEAFFYRLRQEPIDQGSDVEVAAWLIYLNKTAYNGLYRVNRKNLYNVPFGRYDHPTICDPATLRACSSALAGAELYVEDFEAIAERARSGDFVYFDPPYAPLSATSSFTSYTSGGFGDAEQARLRDLARRLKERGVHVLLSNSSAPEVRALYAEGFEVREVLATRSVNSKASGRGAVTELIIR